MVHLKGRVDMEAFGSGSSVALPTWWTIGSAKRLHLFSQVQGWAGEADAAAVSLQSWAERVYLLSSMLPPRPVIWN